MIDKTDNDKFIMDIISLALKEDLGRAGDLTSQSIFSENDRARAVIKSKDTGIIAGTYLIEPIFSKIDQDLSVTLHVNDGDKISTGSLISTLEGSILSILTGERTVLNFIQRLSGIATKTHHLSGLIKDTKTRLLDTRKTTPLHRYLEKRAVRSGGGDNHRMGLYDMVMIKDTHVKAAGGIGKAIRKVKDKLSNKSIKIEAEAQSFEEFLEAAKNSPDRIMLDNMHPSTIKKCVDFRNSQKLDIELEASGNITGINIRSIAETGVDFISMGALTHSVKSLDIHLVIQ